MPWCDNANVFVLLQNEQILVAGYNILRLSCNCSAEDGKIVCIAAFNIIHWLRYYKSGICSEIGNDILNKRSG